MLDHFEDNIRRVIADIRPQIMEKVIENWTSRLDYIRASRCSHMPEVIFKMNEKVSNHGSIPITIECNVVAFLVFEEGFHQPIKLIKQSVLLDVTVFGHTLVDYLHSKCVSFFVDVAIQPEVRFIAKQNSLMKIGNNGNLVLGPFDESTPCLMIVLMNCQINLRINHLTGVK
ncbi:hypothetical protein TNCV_580061 [Trichonephila clavipes]|nr:hypothetical protein TNCV_580061 [Trichonephila clavipes]